MQNGRWTCQNVANTIQNGRWTCPHAGDPMQNRRWTCQNVANTIQNGRWTCPHVVNPMQNGRWTCPNVANTMQNDKFKFQTVANTRQMVPAKKSKKKSQTCWKKKILKLFHTRIKMVTGGWKSRLPTPHPAIAAHRGRCRSSTFAWPTDLTPSLAWRIPGARNAIVISWWFHGDLPRSLGNFHRDLGLRKK